MFDQNWGPRKEERGGSVVLGGKKVGGLVAWIYAGTVDGETDGTMELRGGS